MQFLIDASPLRATRVAYSAYAALYFIFVIFCLTPSHYGYVLDQIAPGFGPIWGESRAIRGDEYNVLTPLFQTAVRGGFSTVNAISPYHEELKGFYALPILDWSLVVKPQLWGFFVLPPAMAFSLYYALLSLSMLIGYDMLLRRLGATPIVALVVSALLFNAHMVQVWWGSNAPAFALAPWAAVVFLQPMTFWSKLLLMTWVTSVWLFGLVYPPFQISGAFALLFAVVAFRPDSFTARNCLIAIGAVIITLICFYLYFNEQIGEMMRTHYPGGRVSMPGGISWLKLLAHVLPFVATENFKQLLPNSNECEVASVSTLLPLSLLCFANLRTFKVDVREHVWSYAVFAFGLTMIGVWIWLGYSQPWGHFLLWDRVPPNRMLWGFGLLLTLGLGVIASRIEFEFAATRWMLFTLLLASGLIFVKPFWGSVDPDGISALIFGSWFDLVPIALTGAALLVCRSLQLTHNARSLLGATAVVASAFLTWGSFNPVQSARPIFDLPDGTLLREARISAAESGYGYAVIPEFRGGSVLSGAGVPAINHVMLRPQLDFFRKLYPDLPATEFDLVFNRYAHIWISSDATRPFNPRMDVIVLPLADFVRPLNLGQEVNTRTCSLFIDALNGQRKPKQRIPDLKKGLISLVGWLVVDGVAPKDVIGFLRDRSGDYHFVGAKLIDRPDVAKHFGDPNLTRTGFNITLDARKFVGSLEFGVGFRIDGKTNLCSYRFSGELHSE